MRVVTPVVQVTATILGCSFFGWAMASALVGTLIGL